jgi:peroxiredoxin
MEHKVGDLAPQFALPNVEGQIISLDRLLAEKQHILLVFLRHLG